MQQPVNGYGLRFGSGFFAERTIHNSSNGCKDLRKTRIKRAQSPQYFTRISILCLTTGIPSM